MKGQDKKRSCTEEKGKKKKKERGGAGEERKGEERRGKERRGKGKARHPEKDEELQDQRRDEKRHQAGDRGDLQDGGGGTTCQKESPCTWDDECLRMLMAQTALESSGTEVPVLSSDERRAPWARKSVHLGASPWDVPQGQVPSLTTSCTVKPPPRLWASPHVRSFPRSFPVKRLAEIPASL